MATIDLTTPPPPPAFTLDGVPRRLTLTLRELELVAELAGGAPLPFTAAEAPAAPASSLGGRLGATPGESEASAAADARSSLREPHESLTRRGILVDGELEESLTGAVGLLATPRVALDIDVAAAGLRAHCWHRARSGVVATLSTADGLVFELAWFGVDQWAGELARVAAIPDDVTPAASVVPASLSLPLELADAVGEALRTGRADLIPALAAPHSGDVTASGSITDAELPAVLAALHQESQGRLRALVADPTGADGPLTVGVLSWTLLRDGWHAVRAGRDGLVDVHKVEPGELAAQLAPVLAEVTG